MNDLETIKAALYLCKSKGWTDAVRLLDQSEVLGTAWGSACTLQVFDYSTSEWILCTVDEKTECSITRMYSFIRSELAYEGPIRVAVAG